MVPCNAEQVRSDSALRCIKVRRAENSEKYLLHDVVRLCDATHASSVMMESRLVTGKEFAELRLTTPASLPQQRRFVHGYQYIARPSDKSSRHHP
jgi:hypothetical protein